MTTKIIIVALLLLAGVVLLLLELFLLPGVGVAGVSGVLSLIGSVVVAYIYLNPVYPWAGLVTLLISLVLIVVAVVFFFKSHAVEKMALDTTLDSHVEMPGAGKRMEQMSRDEAEPNDTKE